MISLRKVYLEMFQHVSGLRVWPSSFRLGKPGFYTTYSMEKAVSFCAKNGHGCKAAVEFHYNLSHSSLKVVTFTKKSTETVDTWMEVSSSYTFFPLVIG